LNYKATKIRKGRIPYFCGMNEINNQGNNGQASLEPAPGWYYTDTHTHLYLNQFEHDRAEAVEKAIDKRVMKMLLPNIDSNSIAGMLKLCDQYPENCLPMTGLHPTSVGADYKKELSLIEKTFSERKFIAVGEIGIDLYWDKTFLKEQEEVFRIQIGWALEHHLPIVVHQRDSYAEIMKVLKEVKRPELQGVFHCFTGTAEQAEEITGMGFLLGIGGVVTFKNSRLPEVIKTTDMKYIVIETDSPFLAPAPYRGKRNESSYIPLIARKIAEIKNIIPEEVARVTTFNAGSLFRI